MYRKSFRSLVVSVLAVFFLYAHVYAGIVPVQGAGQVSYDKQSKKAAFDQALHEAKMDAVDRYVHEFGRGNRAGYQKIRAFIWSDIDRFVEKYSIKEKERSHDDKTVQVVILADIDVNALESELLKVAGVSDGYNDDANYIAFVFVSREEQSVRLYDSRKTRQHQIITSDKSVDGVRTQGYSHTQGGSIFRQKSKSTWDVSTVNELNTAMNNVFTAEGYKVVDAGDLIDATNGKLHPEKFVNDYKTGNDITHKTRKDAFAGCKAADIDYFATGTLDIGIYDTVAPGMERVNVSVTGKIWSLKERYPLLVASVGPVQCDGIGSDQRVARLNALKVAGESVARQLTAQLRVKGIQ